MHIDDLDKEESIEHLPRPIILPQLANQVKVSDLLDDTYVPVLLVYNISLKSRPSGFLTHSARVRFVDCTYQRQILAKVFSASVLAAKRLESLSKKRRLTESSMVIRNEDIQNPKRRLVAGNSPKKSYNKSVSPKPPSPAKRVLSESGFIFEAVPKAHQLQSCTLDSKTIATLEQGNSNRSNSSALDNERTKSILQSIQFLKAAASSSIAGTQRKQKIQLPKKTLFPSKIQLTSTASASKILPYVSAPCSSNPLPKSSSKDLTTFSGGATDESSIDLTKFVIPAKPATKISPVVQNPKSIFFKNAASNFGVNTESFVELRQKESTSSASLENSIPPSRPLNLSHSSSSSFKIVKAQHKVVHQMPNLEFRRIPVDKPSVTRSSSNVEPLRTQNKGIILPVYSEISSDEENDAVEQEESRHESSVELIVSTLEDSTDRLNEMKHEKNKNNEESSFSENMSDQLQPVPTSSPITALPVNENDNEDTSITPSSEKKFMDNLAIPLPLGGILLSAKSMPEKLLGRFWNATGTTTSRFKREIKLENPNIHISNLSPGLASFLTSINHSSSSAEQED